MAECLTRAWNWRGDMKGNQTWLARSSGADRYGARKAPVPGSSSRLFLGLTCPESA